MRIFKKKECCCKENYTPETIQQGEVLKKENNIKILGSGCTKCKTLEDHVKEALAQLQMEIEVQHITDFAMIASYGVMSTPALVIDQSVVSYGKVLSVDEVKKILLDKKGKTHA